MIFRIVKEAQSLNTLNIKLLQVLCIALMMQINISAQNFFPANVPGALAWFKTEVGQDDPTIGIWKDHGPYNIVPFTIDGGITETGYKNFVYSVNGNPGLYFDASHDQYGFISPKTESSSHTIIAVLIPENREQDLQEWILYETDETVVSYLGTDYWHYNTSSTETSRYDYGDFPTTYPSDLYLGNGDDHDDEADRRGKVVSTNVLITPDKCHALSEWHARLLNVYSELESEQQQTGIIPEFIIFNRVLSVEERVKVESYLSLKYGISKHYNYQNEAEYWKVDGVDECEKDDFLNRIHGIGAAAPFLNQSSSNSYYDEKDVGQLNVFGNPDDFFNNEQRLLTTHLEDESSTILDRWNHESYFVCADNDEVLGLVGMDAPLDDFERMKRLWKSQYTPSALEVDIPDVSWCNFIDLLNSNGTIGRKYAEEVNDDRDGVMASSMGIDPQLGQGEITFSIDQLGVGDGATIGYSLDNYIFINEDANVDPFVENCISFLYVLRIDGTILTSILHDSDENGDFETETNIGLMLNTSDQVSIAVQYTGSGYTFNTTVQNNLINTTEVNGDNTLPVFAKMLFTDDAFRINDISASGFFVSEAGYTNHELSYSRVQNYFPLANISEDQINLIIDRSGTGNFDVIDTEFYPGVYSRTPNNAHNKLEWFGIPWNSFECEVFTFATATCDYWTPVIGELEYDCCGQGAYIPITIEGCAFDECFNFKYFYEGEFHFGCIPINDDEPYVIYLENGTGYSITFYAPDNSPPQTITFDVDNQNIPPQDLVPDELCFAEFDETIIIDGSIALSNYDVIYVWTGPNNFVQQGPILELTEGLDELGEYILTAYITCDVNANPVINCSVIDQIEICSDIPNDCTLELHHGPCGTYFFSVINSSPCDIHYTVYYSNGEEYISGVALDEVFLGDILPLDYTITITSVDRCCDIEHFPFTIPQNSDFDILGEDFCLFPNECQLLDATENMPQAIRDADPQLCQITYAWFLDDQPIGNNQPTLLACLDGTYRVEISFGGNCSDAACTEIDEVAVTCCVLDCSQRPRSAEQSITCPGDLFADDIFYAQRNEELIINTPDWEETIDKVEWYLNGKLFSNDNSIVAESGKYYIRIFSGDCIYKDEFLVELIEPENDIRTAPNSALIDIKYSNPIIHSTNYQFTADLKVESEIYLMIYSSEGRLYKSIKSPDQRRFHQFDIALPVGSYYLNFHYLSSRETIKIVSQ